MSDEQLKLRWKVVGASVQGQYHIDNNIPCQDALRIDFINENTGVIALSDGAGSYPNSHIGSAFITKEAVNIVKEIFTKKKQFK